MNERQEVKKERRFYRANNHLARLHSDGKWHIERQVYYRKAGLFRAEINVKLDYLYLYEEDGLFYDFFSGLLVGEKATFRDSEDEWLMRNGHSLAHFDWRYSDPPTISEYPTSKFADEVKNFMPYKDMICKYIKDMLEGMDADRKRESALKESKKLAEERETSQKRSWLDDIINNR